MIAWLSTALRLVILAGLIMAWIGTIIPIFPGPTVMWLFVLLYGLVAGFGTRGAIFFGVISLLTVVSWFTDNYFSLRGARQGGADMVHRRHRLGGGADRQLLHNAHRWHPVYTSGGLPAGALQQARRNGSLARYQADARWMGMVNRGPAWHRPHCHGALGSLGMAIAPPAMSGWASSGAHPPKLRRRN